MPDKKMYVIPEPKPDTRTIFQREGADKASPLVTDGKGDTRHLCGSCSLVLVDRLGGGNMITNVAYRRPVVATSIRSKPRQIRRRFDPNEKASVHGPAGSSITVPSGRSFTVITRRDRRLIGYRPEPNA